MAAGQERALRRRIRSVKATQKITRAFELIATSQIARAQARIAAAKPYLDELAHVLAEAAKDAAGTAGRVLGVPESPARVLVLSIVADRGLCGAYNANVLRPTERMLRSGGAGGPEYRLVTAGRKAHTYFRFRRIEAEHSFSGFSDRPAFSDARSVAEVITPAFLEEEVDQVLVVSTRFLSAGSQVVETRQLLPMPEPSHAAGDEDRAEADGGRAEGSERQGYVEFEPESSSLLVELVPRYVETAIFDALLEASASEHTARQRAMASATDNAEELTKTLTRAMNRARQEAITTEIMEIVGGAEALRRTAVTD